MNSSESIKPGIGLPGFFMDGCRLLLRVLAIKYRVIHLRKLSRDQLLNSANTSLAAANVLSMSASVWAPDINPAS